LEITHVVGLELDKRPFNEILEKSEFGVMAQMMSFILDIIDEVLA
jgi:hypothetical protein